MLIIDTPGEQALVQSLPKNKKGTFVTSLPRIPRLNLMLVESLPLMPRVNLKFLPGMPVTPRLNENFEPSVPLATKDKLSSSRQAYHCKPGFS